jgi:hypothetical protein
VFVVNLKGRPFMGGLTENRPLLYSLAAAFALVFMSARYSIQDALYNTLLDVTVAHIRITAYGAVCSSMYSASRIQCCMS